jgi:hypothetical protein
MRACLCKFQCLGAHASHVRCQMALAKHVASSYVPPGAQSAPHFQATLRSYPSPPPPVPRRSPAVGGAARAAPLPPARSPLRPPPAGGRGAATGTVPPRSGGRVVEKVVDV